MLKTVKCPNKPTLNLFRILDESTNSEIADIIISATGARGSNANYAKNLAQGLRNLDLSESKDQQIYKIENIVTRRLKGTFRVICSIIFMRYFNQLLLNLYRHFKT